MTNILIAKYCSALKSDDKKKRKQSLEKLFALLQEHDSDLVIIEKVEVYKNILRCFSDKAETCRELAVNVITEIISSLSQEEEYYVYLMPTLVQRIGGQEMFESSEEVRLLEVSLLHCVVKKANPSLLSSFLNDIIQILVNTLVDPYPKVKKESCECVVDLAETIPTHFFLQARSLVTPTLRNFTHQHFRVRISAINAIGKVVRYGNNASLDSVIGPLAERLFDQTPMVRQAVVCVIGMWLVELPDRYSYFHKLLPLILTSLSDEVPELRTEAMKLWEEAGKLYMQENENDIKDQMDFLTEDPAHYPPLETRPNLGCRTLVKRNLCKIVPALVNELEDWLVDIRVKASQLLYALILNAEIQITHHLEKILVGMYRASNDEDARVADNVEKAAELIGYFVPADTYCKIVLPTMEDSANMGQLRVFAAILKGSERTLLKEKLTEIGDFLKRPEICYNKEALYQRNLLNCCITLMLVCKEDCKEISYQLFVIMISILGLASNDDVTKMTTEGLHMLEKIDECSSLQELFKKHVQPVLEMLQNSVASWSLHSPERFIFEAILCHAGSVLGLHLVTISTILITCLKPEKDPEVKLRIFTILSTNIFSREDIFVQVPDSEQFLVTFVKVILKRLDDVSDDVRLVAVTTLVKLFKPLPTDYCMEISYGHIEALFGTMLIHLDDPDPGFQKVMLDALKELSELNSKHLWEKVNSSLHKFRNVDGCRELLKHTERLQSCVLHPVTEAEDSVTAI
ncbi:dynein axonemal assembly factor 5 isoform X2 [Periplaneta americana]|uniref:dynein axonemal assembly factor 5 isoform X2 n=1 Tax=Periplaneta americana TaxID=6978 RepID=UPI0037E7EE48